MKTMNTVGVVILAAAVVALVPGTMAVASVDTGTFFARVEGDSQNWNQLNAAQSGGDGWKPAAGGTGPWFSYPQDTPMLDPWGNTENNPTFWNQWWYDGVYDPTRWKLIDLSFTYQRFDPADNGFVVIVVNWSTPGWGPGTDAPPLVDSDGGIVYIGRQEIETLTMQDDLVQEFSIKDFQLPIPYNPEWVSIDIRGYNFELLSGVIVHKCVPEPATITLLALASLGLISRRRR